MKKTILTGKFTALQVYLNKQENAQINNLTFNLKKFEKNNKTQSE